MRNLVLLLVTGLLVGGGRSAAAAGEPWQATGLVVPYRKIELAVPCDGLITEVLVKEGDTVAAGQVLAKLDAARESLEADAARLVMEQKAAEMASAEMLFKEKIISSEQWRERRIEAQLAEAQYRLARQRVESKSLKAPFAGIVVRIFRERGESIHSLERLVELVNLDRVYVILYFHPADSRLVKPGQRVQVTLPEEDGRAFAGTVEIVDPVVDPASGLFRVKVVAENADRRIRTGVKANVVLTEQLPHASLAQ